MILRLKPFTCLVCKIKKTQTSRLQERRRLKSVAFFFLEHGGIIVPENERSIVVTQMFTTYSTETQRKDQKERKKAL